MRATVYTIGHSTRGADQFIALLDAHRVRMLVDVRTIPRSRHNPQFNADALAATLMAAGIGYIHMPSLGGLRRPDRDSINSGWRNESFRGYADYMQTIEFKNAINTLRHIAQKQFTAYMCSEAVWWSCHRALVSDYLKIEGWTVMHIMNVGKATEHPFTKPARVVDGQLRYDELHLFN